MSDTLLASETVLERLTRLHPKLIDLSLGRVFRLLDRLGNPQDRLPPVAHVAGTNGKGSTCAFARAIAEAAGLRAHVYTSPHLVRFHERIRVAGRLVEEEVLYDTLLAVEDANAGDPITFFEITTGCALKLFADTPADIAILEVGLGGRLDATNVVARPAATAITSIGFDHMEWLGDTLSAIAWEKAGILRAGVPAVTGAQPAEAFAAIAAEAERVGARLLARGGTLRSGWWRSRYATATPPARSTCRCPRCLARTRSTTPASRSPPCAPRCQTCQHQPSSKACAPPTGPRGCNACAAVRLSRRCPTRGNSGWMAATTRRRARRWPRTSRPHGPTFHCTWWSA